MTEAAPNVGVDNGNEPPAPLDNAQQPNAQPAAPPAPPDWRESLPENVRSDPSIAKFMTAKDLNEFAGIVSKSYINAASLIGRDRVPIPKTDEDWANWYKAAGRPDDPTGYELKVPEGVPEGFYDAASADVFKAKAHEAGLNARQAAGLHDWYVGMTAEAKAAEASAIQAELTRVESAMRQEWGAAYDAKTNAAKTIVAEIGGEDFAAYLNETKLGNDPRMVRAMAKVAEMLKGDSALIGAGADVPLTPAQVDGEIGQYRETNKDALLDKWHPNHNTAVAGLTALYEKRHPKKAVA